MSTAHMEEFYRKASTDQALFQKMMAGTTGPDDFVRNAVATGKQQGYSFTFEEANAWIKQQQDIKASGELSDAQLESVAGGKSFTDHVHAVEGGAGQTFSWIGGAGRSTANFGQQIGQGLQSAGNAVASFFSSW